MGKRLTRRCEWPNDDSGRGEALCIERSCSEDPRLFLNGERCCLPCKVPGTSRRGVERTEIGEAVREKGGLLLGTGDLKFSRLYDLRQLAVERGRGMVVVGVPFLECEGVVGGGIGLYLWPTSKLLVFVLPFHRGRVGIGDGDWRDFGTRTAETVVDAEDGVKDGVVDLAEDGVLPNCCEGRGRDNLLPFNAADICGIPEYRFTFDMVLLVALVTELVRLLDVPFDEILWKGGAMASDNDDGELPGVSPPTLPVAGLSAVMDNPESCAYPLRAVMSISSNEASITLTLAFNASNRALMSDKERNIPPFTVRRSLRPRSMMEMTCSMAGT